MIIGLLSRSNILLILKRTFTMKKLALSILIALVVLIFSFHFRLSLFADDPAKAITILRQAFEVNRTIKTLSVTVLMTERIGTESIQKKTDFKIRFNPYEIYLKQYYPNVGLEILYNKDITGDKALLNRNTVAFSTLRLDPLGNLMRKESHHSIFKAGFSFLLDVLEHLCDKYPENSSLAWHYEGIVRYDDVVCHKIVFDDPHFGFTDYTLKEGENLESLSRKKYLCDYMIFENNPQFRSFDDFRAGIKIKIPTDYAKQIIVYIDRERLVPIGLKVYDDKGLFEEYTYRNIVINPEFPDNVFDSANPEYGF